MTKDKAYGLIKKVYEHNEHRKSDKEKSLSCSQLIGSMYQAKLALEKTPTDPSLVHHMFKRSSTIGTAFHEYAEKIMKNECDCEVYSEREIEGYTVSGTCDIIYPNEDGTHTLMDWKTAYGKERKASNLSKDCLQMSVYRWLNQDKYNIRDEAYTLFISQSNNAQDAYEIGLMSLDETEDYIINKLYAIDNTVGPDCFDAPYNPCHYCEYSNCQYRKEKK